MLCLLLSSCRFLVHILLVFEEIGAISVLFQIFRRSLFSSLLLLLNRQPLLELTILILQRTLIIAEQRLVKHLDTSLLEQRLIKTKHRLLLGHGGECCYSAIRNEDSPLHLHSEHMEYRNVFVQIVLLIVHIQLTDSLLEIFLQNLQFLHILVAS